MKKIALFVLFLVSLSTYAQEKVGGTTGIETKAMKVSGNAGTGTRVGAWTSAGQSTNVANGTEGQVLSISGGAVAWTTPYVLVGSLSADVSNSTTTAAKITGLDKTLSAGVYQFVYYVRYQSSATTTGIKLSVNNTGTVSWFVANIRWVDASATASTATPSQANVQAAGAVMGAFSARAVSTAGWGTLLGVDAANGDMLAVVEGSFQISTSGNIELWHGSETAAATTIKAGSSLVITKVQ